MVSLKPGVYRLHVAVPLGFRPAPEVAEAVHTWVYIPDARSERIDGILTATLRWEEESPDETLETMRARSEDPRLLHIGASRVTLPLGPAVFSRDLTIAADRSLLERVQAIVYHPSGLTLDLVLAVADVEVFEDALVDLAQIANTVELEVVPDE